MEKPTNPYSTKGLPRTRPSAVVSLDVLGFTSEIREAHKKRRTTALLSTVTSTLTSWYDVVRGSGFRTSREFWRLKAFTDNVVIGHPFDERTEESALVFAIDAAATLQRGLALEGEFFVRGGVAVGGLYMSEDVVFGVGLLDAHEAEQQAIVPRVILHPTAISVMRRHARRYASGRSPQSRLLLRDEDGRVFVNYLAEVWPDEAEPPSYTWLTRHRRIVAKRLRKWSCDPRIFAKYAWVARYHNYVCSTLTNGGAYKIRFNLSDMQPRRLS